MTNGEIEYLEEANKLRDQIQELEQEIQGMDKQVEGFRTKVEDLEREGEEGRVSGISELWTSHQAGSGNDMVNGH